MEGKKMDKESLTVVIDETKLWIMRNYISTNKVPTKKDLLFIYELLNRCKNEIV